MMAGKGSVKFTRQDHKGICATTALEVLASVIYALMEEDGRDHTATLLEGTAAAIRDVEDWTLGQVTIN